MSYATPEPRRQGPTQPQESASSLDMTPPSLNRLRKITLRVRRAWAWSQTSRTTASAWRQRGSKSSGTAEPRPAAGVEEIVDGLARPEHDEERCDRPEVDDVGGHADDVVHDPRELGEDHADRLRPRGGRDLEQLLDRERPAVPVPEGRAVVEAVGVGDGLPVGALLRHLLDVGVHVADLGRGVDDRLAVEKGLHS